jgi:hypothetical protein
MIWPYHVIGFAKVLLGLMILSSADPLTFASVFCVLLLFVSASYTALTICHEEKDDDDD